MSDGTFLFDNIWGDTVMIKTQSSNGDTWLFYSDTINHTYIATITSVDTMSILGIIDSVKTIVINSYHGGIYDSLDPLNNFNIILSKNSGFVEIFDLYTFPYYSPASGTYASGNDRYLDYVCGGYHGYGYPQASNSEFTVVSYHNPTSLEMYNFNVGDMFAGNYGTLLECGESYISNYTHYDSVIYKIIVDSSHVNYAIHHIENGTYSYGGYGGGPFTGSYIDTLYTDTSLVFLTQMPEERTVFDLVFYFYPSDTTFCYLSPAYMSTMPWIFEGCPFEAKFKQGFLTTYDTPVCPLAGCPSPVIGYDELINDVMFSALMNGTSCDSIILPPLAVNKIIPTNTINIFPNPATTELFITSTYLPITNISITNLIGQTVYTQHYSSPQIQVNVADLPPGIYFVKVNGSEVRKFVKS